MIGLEALFAEWKPDLVVAPGDVNSTLAAGLAAAKLDIPVCHLEAGLRSFDRSMPEEHNRRLTDHLSTLLLTHSEDANENLANEGIRRRRDRIRREHDDRHAPGEHRERLVSSKRGATMDWSSATTCS